MSDAASALSKVLGRGSAHEGAHHWRVQRLTALALALLGPWFLVSLVLLPDFSYEAARAWAGGLVNATLLTLLLFCLSWHSMLGVQVVVEDYIRGWQRMTLLVLSSFAHVLIGALGALAIVRLALGSQA